MAERRDSNSPPAYEPGAHPTESSGPWPGHQDSKTPLPDDFPSTTPHLAGPGVVYVAGNADSGQIVLPDGAGQANVEDAKKTFIPQIILSCLVFWLFGCLFGLIAFILAMLARSKQHESGQQARKTADDLGKASHVTSVVGIVVAVFVVFIVVLVVILSRFQRPSVKCDGFNVDDTCYLYRSVDFTSEQCKKLHGYYSQKDNTCYYGIACGSGYFVNYKCYPFVDTAFTAYTCANIGGHFATSDTYGNSGKFCYYTQFNCTFYAINHQCYRFKSAVHQQTECDSKAGYHKHGYCYYECPDNQFLKDEHCYNLRFAHYTQFDCEAVGGLYDDNYCYLKGCNYTMINNTCYKNKSPDYSSGTCMNIGGYYGSEAVHPYKSYCYYTSFNCRYHAVNGQCYSRSSNHSRAVCKTIAQSYYDANSNTCYYYCTEIPKLQQCFVDDNPSFSRGTCKNIGGIYFNGTCYYVSPYCPMHSANNGQCYSKRSTALTCDTCGNIGGHYVNEFCYYNQNNCSAYSVEGQCYSNRSSRYSYAYCNNMGGLYRGGNCYYEANRCRTSYQRNCTCFRYRSSSKTAGTCANIGGYYDFKLRWCLYNSSYCPYYSVSYSQCYKYRNANLSRTVCTAIRGYYAYSSDGSGRYRYFCFFNQFNCSHRIHNQCYLRFSSLYNEATCASIRGYYSQNDTGCFYNSSTCRYWKGGQCYDKYYSGWSKSQCDEANGYFYASYYRRCYISNYYCPFVFSTYRKCYFHTSASYDCSSCRLLDGFMHYDTCYYSSDNCSEPLFLASNGQCYENQTKVRTAAECTSMSKRAFYDEGLCYFAVSLCSSAHEVNCQCYTHTSSVYTIASCKNFGGYHTNGTCYYNSSHCPDRYYSINGQCYRQSARNSLSTCRNIGGYYDYPSDTCYYNSFNCSGFIVDRRHCYLNRSANYSRGTCESIDGIYGYLLSGRLYRSASSFIYSYRIYYCLYDTFNCAGYVHGDECYLRTNPDLSPDTCKNIGGKYDADNRTCRYHEYYCPYYNAGGQCHKRVSCNAYSCDTCNLYGGYYEPRSRCCYYTSRVCQYFVDGECYKNYTSTNNASDCDSRFGGYFFNGRCYYRVRQNCSVGEYYHQCTCYPHRSSTYSNYTCYNINGYYTDNYCYYVQFNCSGYFVNQQCYSRSSARMTRATCDNIGGYFGSAVSASGRTTTVATGTGSGRTTTTTGAPATVDRCYYDTFDCPGYAYRGQCYANRSSELSCPTCNNIGGVFDVTYGCYYYSVVCRYRSVGQQCHTNRSHIGNSTGAVTCRRKDGYQHSDGYCYFTPSNCSSYQYYANCQCYLYYTTSYTRATCINLRGYYFNGGCYNNGSCRYYWSRGQCYNRRIYTSRSGCSRRGGVYTGYYCYYNYFY